ncbi:hypothetical protein VTN77DRAFT_5831 [Rasamsonia byssochlamydoides]|uniref:uncharacterized protein n=1 Tax=Rasamsonia byssochlamydoides TaxID=89139 RepID=UPI0037436B7F
MTEPLNASPAPATATSAPQTQSQVQAQQGQQSVLQNNQQFQVQNQASDQNAQVTTTTAAQAAAAAAAAAAVAAVGNQNGHGLANPTTTEELACMWQGCTERFSSAEALYEHVCERHVGRKSTNNLNLTCQWGTCRTTTVKRDHITSHIRVHVPLKPHKCDLCGKAFKRPQDLKKHVKTHADDSVLMRSPEPGARNQDVQFGGMVNNKGFSTGTHYFESLNTVHAGQGYHQGPPQYYQGGQQQQPTNPSYGNVFYTLNQGDSHTSYESRKRAYESVNEFFGDTKRRQFDPTSYAAIGQRLASLQGLQLPLSGGPSPDFPGLQSAVGVSSAGGYGPTALAAPAYHLPPMSNARTKSDLIDLDRMLDTIHTTVYENDDHVAAAGVAQPGATYIPQRVVYGATQSPPMQMPSSHATATTMATTMATTTTASSASVMAPSTAHSPASATPALTPPSSAQSYTSGRSPGSYSHRVSPPQHEASTPMYPRLPSTTMQENISNGYPTTSGAAPPSTLSGSFEYDDHRRRYTGGSLTRARADDYSSRMPIDSTTGDEEQAKDRVAETTSNDISNSLIDPALHRGNSPDPEEAQRTAQAATEAAKRAEEQWLENVRILEQLRAYIKDRLARGDYEEDDEPQAAVSNEQHEHRMESVEATSTTVTTGGEHQSTPTPAKAEEQAAENKAETHVEGNKPEESGSGLYPTLKGVEDEAESKSG